MTRHGLQLGRMWWQHTQRLQHCCRVVGETVSRGPPLHHFQPRKPLLELISPGSIYDRHHSHRRILWSKTWGNHCLQWPVRSVLAQECCDSIVPSSVQAAPSDTSKRNLDFLLRWSLASGTCLTLRVAGLIAGDRGASGSHRHSWPEQRYLGAALPDTLIRKSTGWHLRDRKDQMKSWVWSVCFNFRQNLKPPTEWGKYQNKRQDSWPRNSAMPTSKQFHSGHVGSASWALVSTSTKLWVWARWFSGLVFTYKILWFGLSFIHLTS